VSRVAEFPSELKYAETHEWVRVEGKKAYVASVTTPRMRSVTSFTWNCRRWERS